MESRLSNTLRGASRVIQYAVAGTVLSAGLQVVVGVLLWSHRAMFLMAQTRLHPELSSDAVRGRTEGIIYGGLGTHLVLFIVYLALARGIAQGRRSARMRLTALLVIASVAGAVAAATFGAQIPDIRVGIVTIQAVSTALRLAVLYLLWVPRAARTHFIIVPRRASA